MVYLQNMCVFSIKSGKEVRKDLANPNFCVTHTINFNRIFLSCGRGAYAPAVAVVMTNHLTVISR